MRWSYAAMIAILLFHSIRYLTLSRTPARSQVQAHCLNLQMFQLSPATSNRTFRKKTFRTCQLKTTVFWTIKVFTGISVDAVGLEAPCLGRKWLQAMDIMATQLFARHITSANMMPKSSRRDIRDFVFVKYWDWKIQTWGLVHYQFKKFTRSTQKLVDGRSQEQLPGHARHSLYLQFLIFLT